MAALILPSRRIIQPQGPVQIDGSRASAGTLSALWVPGLGNLAGKLGGALLGNESAPFGFAQRFNNGLGERSVLTSDVSWVPTSGGYSLILLRRYGSAVGTGDAYGVGSTTLTHRATLYFGTSGQVSFDYGGATVGTTRVTGSVSTAAGDIHCFVATTGPSGMRIFCDGRLVSSNSANPTRVNGGTRGFVIGDAYGGTSGQWSAGLAGAWSSQLDDRLARSLSENPWQLFKPIQRRIWVPVSTGGSGSESQTVAFTLDGISAAVAQVAGRTQSASATLDGVTFAASQVTERQQTLAATLDGVSFAAVQSVGGANAQSLSITLDGVTFAAAQTLEHSQSLAASLEGVTFAASQAVSNPVKDQAVSITLDGIGFAASQTGPKPADFVELLGGGPGLPKKRKQIEKGSYLERLLSPPLVDRLERIKPEAAEVIEEVAQEAVQQLEPMPVAVQALRKDLKAEGIAYREAYREVLAQLVSEMKRVQEEEEEELTAVLAAIF